MDTLRVSCPWDREQTHASLLRYLLEEAYEAAEAIEAGDLAALREEIGDVMFQAFFHARIAAERPAAEGGFTIDDVADTLAAKLDPPAPARLRLECRCHRRRTSTRTGKRSRRPSGRPRLARPARLRRGGGAVGARRRAVRPARAVPGRAVAAAGAAGGDPSATRAAARWPARARPADPEAELRAAARRYADSVRSGAVRAAAAPARNNRRTRANRSRRCQTRAAYDVLTL